MKKNLLFFIVTFIFASCMQYSESKNNPLQNDSAIAVKKNFPSEDEFYSIFYVSDLIPGLRNIRPAKSDSSIQFCIPAAFTVLENDSIDGLFIIDGKIMSSKINHHLGG